MIGVILQTECLPQEPDFKDQGDLWRGQRSGKTRGEWWVSFFLTEGFPQEPDFEDQGDLWRGQRSGKAEWELWVSFSYLRAYLRNLILRTRVTSREARGQAKQEENDGCHSADWWLTSGTWFWGPGWPLERPEVRQSSRRVMDVILLTEGLPQEPDFEDQDDLWRGQRSGKAEGER